MVSIVTVSPDFTVRTGLASAEKKPHCTVDGVTWIVCCASAGTINKVPNATTETETRYRR